MALNLDLLLILAMEQQQALITVNRCCDDINRLLLEEQQRIKAAQAEERRNDEIESTPSVWPARLVPQCSAPKRARLDGAHSSACEPIESSDEEDEALLQGIMEYDLSLAQAAQIQPPSEIGAASALRIAGAALQLIASWSVPTAHRHEHERPTHSPPPTVLVNTAGQSTATAMPAQQAPPSKPDHTKL